MDYFDCKKALGNTDAYKQFVKSMHNKGEDHIDLEVFYALAYKCISEAFGKDEVSSLSSNGAVADYLKFRQNAVISKLRDDGIELEI